MCGCAICIYCSFNHARGVLCMYYLTSHLIGCRKNGKLRGNFRLDYAEISKIDKVVPLVISNNMYKVHVKVFMTCLTFFSHLLTGTVFLHSRQFIPRFLRRELDLFSVVEFGKTSEA